MPLIALLRALFGALSLAILAFGAWRLWSWWGGRLEPDGAGALVFVRDERRLWMALALLALSFLGRIPITFLLARRDTDPSRPRRQTGVMIEGPEGSHLYAERRGVPSGLPLVLTHGWGLDSTIWDYASRGLGKHHPLVVWDLPGLGKSAVGKGEISLPAFAANLRSVVEGLTAGRVILVGHSIGGMTIQTLARLDPEFVRDRVAGVVLINTTWTNPLRTMIFAPLFTALRKPLLEPLFHVTTWIQPLAWLGAWQGYLSGSAHIANRLGFGRYVTRSQLEHTTLLATRNPPGVQARGDLAMFDWDATDAFAALDVPVLVLGGDRDIVTLPEAGRQIASSALDGAYEELRGVNHMGFLERADAYHDAIRFFIDRLPQPARRV